MDLQNDTGIALAEHFNNRRQRVAGLGMGGGNGQAADPVIAEFRRQRLDIADLPQNAVGFFRPSADLRG